MNAGRAYEQRIFFENVLGISSHEEFFNLPPGTYKLNLQNLRQATGKIILKLIPND